MRVPKSALNVVGMGDHEIGKDGILTSRAEPNNQRSVQRAPVRNMSRAQIDGEYRLAKAMGDIGEGRFRFGEDLRKSLFSLERDSGESTRKQWLVSARVGKLTSRKYVLPSIIKRCRHIPGVQRRRKSPRRSNGWLQVLRSPIPRTSHQDDRQNDRCMRPQGRDPI